MYEDAFYREYNRNYDTFVKALDSKSENETRIVDMEQTSSSTALSGISQL